MELVSSAFEPLNLRPKLEMHYPNHDPDQHLSWYETLDTHPDANTASIADSLRDQCSEYLTLNRPYPAIIWFRDAELPAASQAFDAQKRRPSPDEDPFETRQRIFRLHDDTGQDTCVGYAPFGRPQYIGIKVGSAWETAIVHELVHIAQDETHGVDWRPQNEEKADEEAYRREEMILAELKARRSFT